MLYHLCRVHMHVTIWALGKGVPPLLQDCRLVPSVNIHKVFPYTAQHVGPLRAPLHWTGHWSQHSGEGGHPPPAPPPRCPPPAFAPYSSCGWSTCDSAVRTSILFCRNCRRLSLSALAPQRWHPWLLTAPCRLPFPDGPKWIQGSMSRYWSSTDFCIF